jgi:hypothetical protein
MLYTEESHLFSIHGSVLKFENSTPLYALTILTPISMTWKAFNSHENLGLINKDASPERALPSTSPHLSWQVYEHAALEA